MLKTFVCLVIFLGSTCALAQQANMPEPTKDMSVESVSKKTPLPNKLYGRWITPDGAYSQEWGVTDIDNSKGIGKIVYYSTRSNCAFSAPAKIDYDGLNLTITATTNRLNCASTFVATLKNMGNGEFSGVIKLDVQGSKYPEINTTIK